MDLNGLSPRETFTATRDAQPRQDAAGRRGEVAADVVEKPLSAPEHDGVLSSFEAGASDERAEEQAPSTKDQAGQAIEQGAVRDRLSQLISARLPTNAELSIDVDSDTHEARFLVRNRETGDLVREIPERELTEILREGPTASGTLVDHTL